MHKLRGYFITGTDTGVGKTTISNAFLRILTQKNMRAVGVKPICAGMEYCNDQWVQSDVELLRKYSWPRLDLKLHGFQVFRTACAPNIAAQIDGRAIVRSELLEKLQQVSNLTDALIVEGAGGFYVPLSPLGDSSPWGLQHFACDLGLPVILVLELRLGCINHALLTAQAISLQGLNLAGWVGNRRSLMPMTQEAENILILTEWLRAPCLGIIPFIPDGCPEAVADYLDASAVLSALGFAA